MIRRWTTRLALPALLAGAPCVQAEARADAAAATRDSAAQELAALEALQPLRLVNPPAFVAAAARLRALPPPDNAAVVAARKLVDAHALALQGQLAAARRVATALAEGAPASRRLQAEVLLVQLDAAARDILAAQRRLERLLAAAEAGADPAVRRAVNLAAAGLYLELSRPAQARLRADLALAADPLPAERCRARAMRLEARVLAGSADLSADEFGAERRACGPAAPLAVARIDLAEARWAMGRKAPALALAALDARGAALEGLGDARLIAERRALRAEALRRLGRLGAAQADTDRVLALAADLPSGQPLLSARRTRYAIALARGDAPSALRELEAVMVAERDFAAELRRVQRAYEAGRGESQARDDAMAALVARNARLEREAADAARLRVVLGWAALPLAVLLLGLAAWTWRRRVRREALRRALQVDDLTGLWARPHFVEASTRTLEAASRRGATAALLLVDLDHFSLVNTRHGHLSGDRMLRAVGGALRALESADLRFARLGGEEFAVLLPDAGIDEALAFAERTRDAIGAARAAALDDAAPVAVTASIGVATTAAAGHRLRDLLASADEALYRAKHAGRDRVCAAVALPADAVEDRVA